MSVDTAQAGQANVKILRMSATRRVVHWGNALSIVVCAVTGFYIANPYYASDWPDVMAWNRAIHLYSAVVLDVSLIVIAYLYVFSRVERPVDALIPNRSNLQRLHEAFLNFVTLNRRKRFDSSRQDPLNGILFVILHILVVFQLFTGLQLYVFGLESGVSSIGSWWPWIMHATSDWTLPLFGGIGGVRLAHHLTTYPIVIWALLHIYYEVWRTLAWKEGDIAISFGGYKFGRSGSADLP